MVQPPGSDVRGLRAFGTAGTFVHRMTVDGAFTLEAGRQIWGYPKVMADFTVRDGNPFGFDVSVDGSLVVEMEIGRGLPVPMPSRPQSLLTYTNLDGTTRETAAEQLSSGFRARIGGASIRLGDHPIAKELASLGLPKKAFACYVDRQRRHDVRRRNERSARSAWPARGSALRRGRSPASS